MIGYRITDGVQTCRTVLEDFFSPGLSTLVRYCINEHILLSRGPNTSKGPMPAREGVRSAVKT
jgi:hypothetical protein